MKRRKLRKRWLKERAELILDILGVKDSELSILITTDEEIRELNKAYRGKDEPTDVLSFPIGEKVGDRLILGDVVISLDTANRQALEWGCGLDEEVERLLAHGIIHLLGYDHELGGEEERKFKALEEKVNAELRRG
ncbi:putative rRNA maturation factor [Hydrogenivirga caldilitoris]|uniref:Endoribonuclease YbeY n=1 Tax=Hydrogenivirga caldilitoris TaxID=246264 RepID=A0A497XS34_9AQUI|nr:putative rRNA maturation factor [Hydrogenivirga caldilitoris]